MQQFGLGNSPPLWPFGFRIPSHTHLNLCRTLFPPSETRLSFMRVRKPSLPPANEEVHGPGSHCTHGQTSSLLLKSQSR